MSWFTEIAGKAEDLLNRVDQTAATALQNKTKQPVCDITSPSNIQEYKKIASNSDSSIRTLPKTLSAPRPSTTATPEYKAPFSPGNVALKKKAESDDEKLLQFLNATDSLPTPARKTKPKMDSPEKKLEESQVPLNIDTAKDFNEILQNKPMETPELKAVPDEKNVTDVAVSNNLASEIKTTAGISPKKTVEPSSTAIQREEFSQSENKSKHAEAEMKRMQKKLDHWNSQISESDKIVRELRAREKDMLAAIDAKDSQLAVLKVRLQESDQELHTKRSLVKDLEAENERMIKEHAQNAAFQNKTVEVLREQLHQADVELNKTKETFLQYQKEQMQKLGKMEEEYHHLMDSYSSLQKKWNELNERSKEITTQLKQSTGNYEALHQEYNDYKQKAQRILQSKEKLISSLKGGQLEDDISEKREAASLLLNAEVESVRQERELIREELRRANEMIETYRSENQELEKMSHSDAVSSQERCRNLKEQLDLERTQKEELQLLSSQLKEELQILRDDLTRTKTGFQSRIQDREIEIEKLRRQLTAKSLSTVSQDELESRLHALTENLIQKQTIVEALSTEKNSLVLQLERVEQQLKEAQNYGLQQHTYIGMNNNETERKSKTVLLENPFDSALTRRVKKVYGSIDAFSIRLGVFFRRYPITRVFVIIYMLLLHFWVMIVLLTYEPEVHNTSYEMAKRLERA